MDFNKIRKEKQDKLNNLYRELSYIFNLEYKVLIYNLLKNGHVKATELAADSGLSTQRLYQIVDEVTNFIKTEGGEINNENIQNK